MKQVLVGVVCLAFVFISGQRSEATPYLFTFSGVADDIRATWNELGVDIEGSPKALPGFGSFIFDDADVPEYQLNNTVAIYHVQNFVLDIGGYVFYRDNTWTFIDFDQDKFYRSYMGGMGFKSTLDEVFHANSNLNHWFESYVFFPDTRVGNPMFVAESDFDPEGSTFSALGVGNAYEIEFEGKITSWKVEPLTPETTPAPEPSMVLLVGGGLPLLGWCMRRNRI